LTHCTIGGHLLTTSAGASTAPPAVLADVVLEPTSRSTSARREAALIIGGALLTAGAAQVSFTLPGMTVPYTLQTAAVLLTGAALGSWRGAASMLLYLAIGALGAPVFSAGDSGVAKIIGPTGGYLVGFVIAASIVGAFAARGWDRSPARAAGLMALGNLIIYAIGVPVLAIALDLPLADAIGAGATPFIPWDAVKIALAAGLLPAAWLVVGRRRSAD
jgi:biotin transport system substrate-specific component